jgi:hypothetical protein
MIAGSLRPAARDVRGQVGPAPRLEIHDEKGHVVGHVDPPQRRAELDRIEGRHPPRVEHDVGQMKVAVALADSPRGPPLLDRAGQVVEPAKQPGFDSPHPLGGVGPSLPQLPEIDRHGVVDARRRAPRLDGGSDRQPFLDGRDRLAEPPAVSGREQAGIEAGIEPVGLVELHELHGPLDRRPVAGHPRRFGRAGDRHGCKVDLRGEPAADANLLLAEPPPLFE